MKENKKMTRLAYVAGLMDGDGSFSFFKRNTLPLPYYYPAMQFCNTNKDIVHYLKDQFGGHVSKRNSWKGNDGCTRKEAWRWSIEKLKSRSFLELLIPHLKLKKERAKLLLSYLDKNSLVKRGDRSYPVMIERENLYLKMKKLNSQSGISNTTIGKIRKTPVEDFTFWSYVAGIFDTDGSFSIKRETKNIINSFKYSPIISLSMKSLESISFIAKNCAVGNIKLIKAKTCKNGLCYRFSIHSHRGCSLLIERCLPYLKLKKESAKILLKFCKQKKKTKYCRGGVSPEENTFREQCYNELIDANNGVYKSPLIDLEVLQLDDRGQDGSQAERLNKETSQ